MFATFKVKTHRATFTWEGSDVSNGTYKTACGLSLDRFGHKIKATLDGKYDCGNCRRRT